MGTVAGIALANTSNRSVTASVTVTAGQTATYTVRFNNDSNHYYRITAATVSGTGVAFHQSTCDHHNNGSNRTITFTITTTGLTPAATYPVTGITLAEYPNNDNDCSWPWPATFGVPDSQLIVQKVATTTTLGSSVNPSTFGQSVTFTATVTSGATGTVTFWDGATSMGTGSIDTTTHQATYTTTALSVTGHNITAVYGGDATYAGSTSSILTQTVNQATTTTSLGSSLNPSTSGQSVTFTATVTAGATGTVNFLDGATTIGSGTIDALTHQATFATSGLAAGSHSITAVYAGDLNYSTSTSSAVNQQVNKIATTTNLTSSVNPSSYAQSVTFTATVSAGTGSVTFSIDGNPLPPVSLLGGSATLTTSTLTVADHVVTATYSGDATHASSTNSLTQTVNKRDQTITFTNPGTKRLDETPFDLSATAGSGLPVTFQVTAGTCTLVGSTVTLHGTGDCTIQASQAGNGTWNAAPVEDQTFSVIAGNQSITFANPGTKSVGTPAFALGATASSGMAVSYQVTDGTCTVDASGMLTVHHVGSCTVEASQEGNASWNAATPVEQTFDVVKGDQTIDFPNPGNQTYSTPPFALSASATSGLSVSFEVTAGTCTLSGNTLTIHSLGDCTVEATQTGDADWNGATPVSRTFSVGAGDQTITFPAIADKPFGTEPFHLGATATSGLPVTYTVSDGTCWVTGDLLTIYSLGDCTVDADQAGNGNWDAAPTVSRTFSVVAGSQTITFPVIPTVSLTSGSVTLAATASSGLPITYTVTDGTCTVLGNVLTLHSVGDCTVQAEQPGTNEWLGAEAVSRTVTVSAKLVLTITANNQARPQGGANPTFTYGVNGYAAGDDDTAITTKPVCTTTATAASPLGTYPISCAGAASDKYDFNYVDGVLTVANEQVAGVTSSPRQVTPPPTNTSGNGNSESGALPLALLISLAFSGLGLLVVTAQRRAAIQQ